MKAVGKGALIEALHILHRHTFGDIDQLVCGKQGNYRIWQDFDRKNHKQQVIRQGPDPENFTDFLFSIENKVKRT